MNAAGEETTSEQSANLARHYFTFHHNTRNFQKQAYGCRNASGSEKFPNRRKLRRNGIRRTKGTNIQPDFKHDLALLNKVSGTPWAPRRNSYNPSFATLLDTQLQPSEKKKVHARFRTTDERDGRHRCGTRTKQQRTTPPPRLPSTSTSSSRPLPDSPMATSPTGRQHPPLPALSKIMGWSCEVSSFV